MKVFVNDAVTNGINAFIAKSQNQEFSLSHIFELRIIEFLVELYGKINILNPFQIENEDNLKNNLMVYGASLEDIDKLFNSLNEYNIWLNSNSREKNTLVKDIFDILSKLVVLKNKSVVISSDEMKYYEDFLTLKDHKIKQIVGMSAQSREDVLNAWPNAVEESKKEPVKEETVLLDVADYEKYGLSIDEVKQLPKERLLELNAEIKEREEQGEDSGDEKKKPLQLILSSGNGFVDALVLFSMMCTEIMIGVIITVLIARF